MYLEKAAKAPGYSFADLTQMSSAVYHGDTYEKVLEALKHQGTAPAEKVAKTYKLAYFSNDTAASFWQRLERIAADADMRDQYHRYLALTPEQQTVAQDFRDGAEELMYWRKANHIHNWFVDKVQGGEDECRPHEVSRDQLLELLGYCQSVLSDPNKAQKLLPTASGFFFGDTDYDDYYFDELRNTSTSLSRIIADTDFDKETVFYQSSW